MNSKNTVYEIHVMAAMKSRWNLKISFFILKQEERNVRIFVSAEQLLECRARYPHMYMCPQMCNSIFVVTNSVFYTNVNRRCQSDFFHRSCTDKQDVNVEPCVGQSAASN